MQALSKAIRLATTAHDGQFDKGGQPYILHPLRVMMKMSTDEERIVAVLHDVIEDTNVLIADLIEVGFDLEVCKAVHALTRQDNESYMDFIKRCKQNELGRKVKIADIEDNMDLSRLSTITDTDVKRVEKYKQALKELNS